MLIFNIYNLITIDKEIYTDVETLIEKLEIDPDDPCFIELGKDDLINLVPYEDEDSDEHKKKGLTKAGLN